HDFSIGSDSVQWGCAPRRPVFTQTLGHADRLHWTTSGQNDWPPMIHGGVPSMNHTPPRNRRSHGISRQLRFYSVDIQPATARPISAGDSSGANWPPLTVLSVCAGKLRARSRPLPSARIPPGSAFRNSFGTLLLFSQSA